MHRSYLDYNATCPVRPQAIDSATAAMAMTGNPSSVHYAGRGMRKIVEDARAYVAALAAVRPAQVIFNSGATEGNNQVLSGHRGKAILVSSVEHPSVIEAAPDAFKIPVTRNGVLDLDALAVLLDEKKPSLVCVQLVNSETGAIQPVAEAAALARNHGAWLHCDAVQAAGRIAIDFKSLGADTMTLSGHKFGSPQGAGALLFREGLLLPKLLFGGGQEKRQRAGTENVAAIAGFGVAARMAMEELGAYQALIGNLRDRLEKKILASVPGTIIAALHSPRVANTSCALLPGATAETQMMAMDLAGISVGSGSACSSGTVKPSHVLSAMGYDEGEARSALRFSLGWATSEDDIDRAADAYAAMARRLKA